MHHLDWLLEIFDRNSKRVFMTHEDRPVSYSWLLENVRQCSAQLDEYGLKGGTIAALRGDYSPRIVAALLALVDRGVIVVRDAVCRSSDEGHDMLMRFYHIRYTEQTEIADAATILARWE